MREAKPYYKKSHKAWYYNDNGKPVRLDADKKKAREIWKKLRARDCETDNLVENPTALVADLVAEFLDWAERNRKPSTYEFYQKHCESFCQRYKTLRIMDLRNLHVTSWIDKCYANCGSSHRNGAITSLKRALNWCRQEGYIKENPIAYCKKPRATTRGDAAYITPEQFDAILKDVKENCKRKSGECFLDLLTVLRETGCRPQEVRRVEARHLTHSPPTWTFDLDESKSGDKTGKARIVYLTKKAYDICRRLALKNPEGPMFRNSDGRPWTIAAINCHFQRIQRRTNIKAFAYALRHTFATDAIENGVDLVKLQELMGHADLQMISKIYQHIQRRKASMVEAAEQAARPITKNSNGHGVLPLRPESKSA